MFCRNNAIAMDIERSKRELSFLLIHRCCSLARALSISTHRRDKRPNVSLAFLYKSSRTPALSIPTHRKRHYPSVCVEGWFAYRCSSLRDRPFGVRSTVQTVALSNSKREGKSPDCRFLAASLPSSTN
jgi:hypothetical protein